MCSSSVVEAVAPSLVSTLTEEEIASAPVVTLRHHMGGRYSEARFCGFDGLFSCFAVRSKDDEKWRKVLISNAEVAFEIDLDAPIGNIKPVSLGEVLNAPKVVAHGPHFRMSSYHRFIGREGDFCIFAVMLSTHPVEWKILVIGKGQVRFEVPPDWMLVEEGHEASEGSQRVGQEVARYTREDMQQEDTAQIRVPYSWHGEDQPLCPVRFLRVRDEFVEFLVGSNKLVMHCLNANLEVA